MTDYEPTPDPRENASRYAYLFTNRDAAEYAVEYLDTTDPDDIEPSEWAHETADSLAAVIYTGQALALYAAGILDNEDDDAVAASLDGLDHTDGAADIITRLVTGLSFEWHRRVLLEAVEAEIEARADAADEDDQADDVEVSA